MYSQAKRDVGREWYKYMESIKPKADELLKAYEDAKLTDDKDLIKETGKEYGQFLRQQTYMNKRYKSMLNTTTTKLANVNEIALAYLNDEMPKVYVTNYNQLSKDMPAGISFDLVDENTVKNLVKDNPKLLPTKKLDIPKDKRWNQKAINSQVLQGIIQGESIDKMAKRLTPIMDGNRKSAIRNARTMTTSAQNKGRLDSYKAAQNNGVVLHKVWMATNSDRTRAWHSDLDGVEVEIDEPFENDYGKIMFPGDPNADPGNVYNCRCTMTAKIIGFRREDGSIKYIEGEESVNDIEYAPDFNNVVDFEGKENVITALKNIDVNEAKIWNEYINNADYKLITSEDSNVAFTVAGTREVNLFDYSDESTFFHETAHSMDEGCIEGTIEIRSSRKRIGSDEWRDSKPFTDKVTSASSAAQEIYDMKEDAWTSDNDAFLKWSGMKDEDDIKSLIHATRDFETKYGKNATAILGDLIDAHTLGKYPMSVFAGGHGESYWNRDASLISKEAWAEISNLKALRQQDAIDELAKILPNRVKSTEAVYNVVFKGENYEHEISDTTRTKVSKTVWRFKRKS